MVVLGVVVLESVLVNNKLYVLTVRIVEYKDYVIIAIIWDSKLVINVLQWQNVGDGSLIKIHLTTTFYISFAGGIDGCTI